ncbi:MAG TPA: PAS domain S-box protein [Burkholderiales bacterium]|nr:PAS domain S-box protein [Burkholderiales bacterium]
MLTPESAPRADDERLARERPAAYGPAPELQEQFRELVGAVEEYAIFLLNAKGEIQSWNAGAERIKGYKAQEIVGHHFSVFYPPESVAAGWPDHELRVAEAAGRFNDEGWRLRKDGNRFWASVTITALRHRDGALRGFLKITRDLTERKRAEEGLRQSEERFRLLIEGVQDYAIYMLDPNGNVASWNVGAERIEGYRAEEIIGRHFSVFYPPDAVAQGRPDWQLRTALEQGRAEDEGWRARNDGTKYWANAVITALKDKDGTLRGFATIVRDMTERRKIEALQRADRQKNEFLALLAHELRNPLAPIRNALYIMGQPEASAANATRAREIAERQVQHMSRLLDDLIDVARVSRGSMELRKELLDLDVAVASAVEAVRPLVQDSRHQLTVAVPPRTLWVDADPARLEQVLINLLTNAIKYTDPGGHIWITAETQGEEVVLRVRDSGIGIDPVMLPRIFELFVQAERRMDRAVGGVGIGLSLVKKLIELHGGTVQAFSAGLGKGTELVVRLPAAKTPEATGARSRADGAPADLFGLRILVVDDNINAADSLATLLELAGHEVRVAYEGEAALLVAEAFKPQVVLLDIGMPGMDGYEVGRMLRQKPQTRSALLIAITGWGAPDDLRRSKEAGFDHHLVKPVEPAALQRLLARKSARAR